MTTSSATATWEGGLRGRSGAVHRQVGSDPGQLFLRHPVRGREGHQSRGADRGGARLLPQHGAERGSGEGGNAAQADHDHRRRPPSTRSATGSRSPACGSRCGAKSRDRPGGVRQGGGGGEGGLPGVAGAQGQRAVRARREAGIDPICHTLVGAGLARSGLARRTALGTTTLLIGANLPDVDVLAYFWGRPRISPFAAAGPTASWRWRCGRWC